MHADKLDVYFFGETCVPYAVNMLAMGITHAKSRIAFDQRNEADVNYDQCVLSFSFSSRSDLSVPAPM